jgi:hypothetical protein
VLISALFLIAGLAAVFGTAGVIFATVMSVVEAIWIPAAAIETVPDEFSRQWKPSARESP